MSLSLQPSFVAKTNSTLPLAQASGINGVAVRVASLVSDILGTITAASPSGTVVFSLSPETPPWVTGVVDTTGLIFTISFSNAIPNGSIPYNFYVTVSDGVSTLYFPITLDVKPPLSLAVTSNNLAAAPGATTISIPSYNYPGLPSSNAGSYNVTIQGIGLNGQVQSGINFVPPPAMPSGQEFLTSDGTKVVLHLVDPTESNISGGLQTFINTPVSTQITIKAYAPGSFYDEPDRAFSQVFTIQSLLATQGILDFIVSVNYSTGAGLWQLAVDFDFLQGLALNSVNNEAINVVWQTSGTATGSSAPSGNTFTFTPTSVGTVSFIVSLQGATTSKIYGTKTLGPFNTGIGNVSWASANAVKIVLSAADNTGYVGDTINITISTPSAEITGGESITVTFPALDTGSALEGVMTPPGTITLNAGNSYSATVSVTVPSANSPAVQPFIEHKWGLRCNATSSINRGGANPATGFAEAEIESFGLRTLTINSAPLTGNTGSAIVPYQLVAKDVESATPIAGIVFSLVGAPDGLNINSLGQIVGNALVPGTYTFQVLAEQVVGIITNVAVSGNVVTITANNSFVAGQPITFANVGTATFLNGQTIIVGASPTPFQFTGTFVHANYGPTADTGSAYGYANSLSQNFTLTVTQIATPLVITNPIVVGATTIPPIETNNTPYVVSWSITGTPKSPGGVFFLQSGSNAGPRDVTGAVQASTSQPTTSVITVYGSSFFGNAYTIPVIVLSSSIQASQQLLPSPTIGTIDENFALTLNWQPFIVAGGYTVYRAWDIYVNQPPNLPPLGLQTINGNLPTGLEFPGSTVSNRIFEATLSSGDWTVSMTALTANPSIATNSNAWDNVHQFPTALTPSSIVFSATTVQLGQSLTISLAPTYTGAQFWSVTYPDGTTTGFIPIGTNTRSVAKAFQTSGPQNIIIQTENDFSTGNPPVKLRRQITLQVFVTTQQFNPASAQENLTGTLGIGGTAGFEIVDATNTNVTPEPWEVINRSLVRDTVTNELKLMVATSRFASASSLLDTMAVDVFPIQGRPLSPEFIDIEDLFGPTPTTNSVPVKITTSILPTIIVGKPMTPFAMSASGGTQPFNWFSDSSLPFGLQLTQDGTLFGTPLTLGTANVNFAVQDNSNPPSISSVTLPFPVVTDLVITTTSLAPATVNTLYGDAPFFVLNTGGLPPFTWSVAAGAFPTGMSIDPTSGQIIGVPVSYNSTTDFKKNYEVTIQVKDTIGATAQATYTIQLLPAALEFGNVDQPTIYAAEAFKLVVPVFGGQSPYTLTAFTDDGTIGSGLQIISPPPNTVTLIAGVVPPVLTLTTSPGPTPFYTGTLPQNISFDLSGFTSGGTAPYNWSITPNALNTLPHAAVYGSVLTGTPIANGTYSVGVTVVDSIGHVATGTFTLFVQQQNAPQGSPVFQVFPVAVSFNGTQGNPFNWSVLPITNPPTTGAGRPNIPQGGIAAPFPDAQVTPTTPWTPQNVDLAVFAATGQHTIYQNYQYFGVAVYQNGVLHMTQNGAPSKVWGSLTTFGVGDTILDTNGHLETCSGSGTTTTVEPGTVSNLTSVGNQSGGFTTYNGTFATPYPANFPVLIAGFQGSGNNGTFTVSSCTGTQLTVNNPSGTAETRSATATFNPWSTVGGSIQDGTVTWTESTTPITGPMVFLDVMEDEEPGGAQDPGGFPSWLNPQNGTTVAGGAFRDFSGIQIFNVTGGTNPITTDAYSWLSLFTNIVSTATIQTAAWQPNTIYFVGQQILDTNGNVETVSSHIPASPWQPNHFYPAGSLVLDSNGNVQQATDSSTSGTVMPTWSTLAGGLTSDFSGSPPIILIWQNIGAGISGPIQPTWNPTIGGITSDFEGSPPTNFNWKNSGPPSSGSLVSAAQRTSVTATGPGQQSRPTTTIPGGTPDIVITDTDVWSIWAPSTGFVVGNQILDINGNIQQVKTISGTGLTGAAVPNWNKVNGGTTVDNQVTWQNVGAATAVTINLTTLPPSGLTFPWYVPVIAEGGSGGPYTFQIISTLPNTILKPNPTTLPNVTTTTLNSLPAFASNTTQAGNYQVTLVATDSVFTTAIWQKNTTYALGQTILDTNGNIEQVTTAGTSGATQPTWPLRVGATVTDGGSLVWTNIGKHSSLPYTVPVNLITTAQQIVHILNSNLPTTLFGPASFPSELGRPIPVNTYFVQADLVSNWTITGQPPGVTISANPSNRGFLSGTPTANGVFNITVTATSASYGTVATFQFTVNVLARTAVIAPPIPTSAVIGIDFRAINNNAIFSVNYVGYQPGDTDLPLLTSLNGTVGAPGVLVGGLVTTQVINLTPGGFTMQFDYQNTVIGPDTVSLKHNTNVFQTASLTIVYPPLVATGTTPPAQIISEYATSALIQPPVSITGGNPPYSINITGESDPRFVPVSNPGPNSALQITVSQFAPGQTFNCQVAMVATDTETSPQSSTANGTVSVTIKQETFITVNYNNQTWSVASSSSPNIYFLVTPNGSGFPNSSGPGVTPVLGHPPFAFNVQSVVLPGGLTGFVTISPSKRVLAINTSGSTTNVNDVDNHLSPSGVFSVPSTASPAPSGSTPYQITVNYQVVDAHGITSTGSANVVVNIS